ncbi:hypothetical protein [Holdemania sp. 1001302B_160321_E10]|uniref:phage tail protein n=1 Tax=Holdemania sp. 1001302B_160321_E10 TaxID=2787120 RepID=UPI001897B26E|nr:hypothetical protein [Holdemania sp. 1001302B_160321_E10]
MAETVNSIRINTRLKTDGITKDRKEIERQLKELAKEAESVKIGKEIDEQNSAIEKSAARVKKLQEAYEEAEKSARKMSEEAMKQTVNDPKAINQSDRAAEAAMNALPASASIEDRDRVAQEAANEAMRAANQTRLEGTKEYQKQVEKLDQINSKLRQEDQLQAEAAAKISNKKVELEGALQRENAMSDSLHGELIKLDQKDQKLRSQAAKQAEVARQTKETQKAAEKHNNSLKRGIKRIAKLSLGVLGVRMAYSAVRKIVSSVTDDNEKLKNTIDAIWAGLGSAFEPIINGLISGFATVLNYAFAIIKALTGINLISKANAKMAKKKKDGGSSGSKLASFDSSEVLSKSSGSGSDPTDTYLKEIDLGKQLTAIVERLKKLWDGIVKIVTNIGKAWKKAWDYAGNGQRIVTSLSNMLERMFECLEHIVGSTVEWSESINFIPLVSSLAGLLESIEPLFNKLMESFEWFWDEIVLPLSSFVIEDGLPAFFDLLSAALDLFNGVCETTRPVAEWLWDNLLDPIASWTGGTIVEVMGWLTEALQELSAWFDENGAAITEALIGFGEQVSRLWFEFIQPILELVKIGVQLAIAFLKGLLEGFLGSVSNIIDDITLVLEGIINFITGVFTGNWEQAWLGVQQIFAGIWNGILDIVQGVIDGIVTGINAVIDAINSISVDIPDWVPFVGGSHFGMNLGHITGFDVTQFKWIPKLAQGAVLPPNKPFVAMLGDQTRGRNLEAPEDLIRQIVREESGSQGTTIVIKADGDLGALIRLLKLNIDEEDRRVGTKLVLEG